MKLSCAAILRCRGSLYDNATPSQSSNFPLAEPLPSKLVRILVERLAVHIREPSTRLPTALQLVHFAMRSHPQNAVRFLAAGVMEHIEAVLHFVVEQTEVRAHSLVRSPLKAGSSATTPEADVTLQEEEGEQSSNTGTAQQRQRRGKTTIMPFFNPLGPATPTPLERISVNLFGIIDYLLEVSGSCSFDKGNYSATAAQHDSEGGSQNTGSAGSPWVFWRTGQNNNNSAGGSAFASGKPASATGSGTPSTSVSMFRDALMQSSIPAGLSKLFELQCRCNVSALLGQGMFLSCSDMLCRFAIWDPRAPARALLQGTVVLLVRLYTTDLHPSTTPQATESEPNVSTTPTKLARQRSGTFLYGVTSLSQIIGQSSVCLKH